MFRPEVLAERQSQWLGTVLLTAQLSHRLFAGFALLAAAAVTGLMIFADYTRKASFDGWLMPQQGLVRVVAPRAGVVTALYVDEGAQVRQGDRLFTLSAELESTTLGATQAEIARGLRDQRQSLLEERARREQRQEQEQAALADRVAGVAQEIDQIDREIDVLESQVAMADDQVETQRDLQKQGYISRHAFQQVEAERLELVARLSALQRERIGLQRERQTANSDLAGLPLIAATDIAALERSIATIEQELAAVEAQREIVVTAPQDGTVTTILAETGGHADGSRPVLSIVPADSQLQARLYGPSSTVGFLQPGQRVRLRYEAYPYQQFGHYAGVIASISRSPLSQGDMEPQLAGMVSFADGNQPVYRITVQLDRQTVTAYGKQLPLQPGMQLEADIELETRPLYEWVLDPLYTLTGKSPQ